ncbi:hypothetical protein XENOCAPTIV_023258 [Xenoophorus captivus]|uniref:Gigaxonin n=1 Tax=Xenoophorus captivus TaxID=1517983 RepID=A0ABV0QKM2_9TELE
MGEPLMREVIREFCQKVLTEDPPQGEAMLTAFKPRGYSECIVLVGGEDRRKPTAVTRCMCPLYDTNRQKWIELQPMSVARLGHGVVAAGASVLVDYFFPVWCSQPRQNFGVVEVDGLIYVLGGEAEDIALTTVEVFDPHFSSWKIQTSMTMIRKVGCYASMNKKIYAIGGGSYGKLFDSVESFDPKTQQWTGLCPLKERRFGSVACGVSQELYVFGGVRSQESENPEQRQMMTCKSEFYHDEMRSQLILRVWGCSDRGEHLRGGRPGYGSVKTQHTGLRGSFLVGVFFDPLLAVCAGTSFDYIREFRRSTGTWHRTKPMLPTDLSKTACAALRIANCRLFRLQLTQGMFPIRL